MKAVIQRVLRAEVTVEGVSVGKISRGYMILFGAAEGDTEEKCKVLAKKIVSLRIFPDENGKTNLSISQVEGEILAVSQFTLLADCSHGNRPSFINAARPEVANDLYEKFCGELEELGHKPEKGVFGADMKIDMVCDGPFTVTLEV